MSPFEPAAYWEDRLKRNYNERGIGDIGMPRSYNTRLYAVRRHVFRRLLRHLALDPSSTTVLDVGSGTGVYIDEWSRWGAKHVTGIDITNEAVGRLRDSFAAAHFIRADVGGSLDGKGLEASYGVVSAFDVLFHIVDDVAYARALDNIYRLVRPGGHFLYSENLVPSEQRLPHYVSRTEDAILAALTRAGFVVEARLPMFVLMNNPVATKSRLLKKWFAMLRRLVRGGEVAGALWGGLLFPLEVVATRFVRRGPGTEILVCRRSPG